MSKPKQYIVKCPKCRSRLVLECGYYGWFYVCKSDKDCDINHSCHQEGSQAGKPHGKPADRETRIWRTLAHNSFDRIWKETVMRRSSSYKWLAKEMNLKRNKCHFAMFDIETCKQVIELCEKKYNREIKKG